MAFDVETILDAFEKEIALAAQTIRVELPNIDPLRTKSGKPKRLGDIISELDDMVYKDHYSPIIDEFNLVRFCEETERSVDGKLSRKELESRESFVLLDSIDGTVNMLQGLTCGVNIAIGRYKGGDSIEIGDIKGVLIADYQSQKMFRWSEKTGYTPIGPIEKSGAFPINPKVPRLFYEVPDGISYGQKHLPDASVRQGRLLNIFRNVFDRDQRRAIDCTGLRTMAMLDGALVAYGDVRGATYTWDTIPSIRIFLDQDDYAVLDGNLDEYTLKRPFAHLKGGICRLSETAGDSIIIVERNVLGQLLGHKDYLLGNSADKGDDEMAKTEIVSASEFTAPPRSVVLEMPKKQDAGNEKDRIQRPIIFDMRNSQGVSVTIANEVEEIENNVSTLDKAGMEAIAKVLREASNAAATHTQIAEIERQSILEGINEISHQANLPADQRMKQGVLKAMWGGISSVLSAAGGLAEVCGQWGTQIANYFGF